MLAKVSDEGIILCTWMDVYFLEHSRPKELVTTHRKYYVRQFLTHPVGKDTILGLRLRVEKGWGPGAEDCDSRCLFCMWYIVVWLAATYMSLIAGMYSSPGSKTTLVKDRTVIRRYRTQTKRRSSPFFFFIRVFSH